jgi:hypothetical protein
MKAGPATEVRGGATAAGGATAGSAADTTSPLWAGMFAEDSRAGRPDPLKRVPRLASAQALAPGSPIGQVDAPCGGLTISLLQDGTMGPRPRRLDVSVRLPPSDTLPPETDPALRQFLLYLGSGLTAAGEGVNEIQVRIRLAYGAPGAVVSVLPTFVTVSLGQGRMPRSSRRSNCADSSGSTRPRPSTSCSRRPNAPRSRLRTAYAGCARSSPSARASVGP